MLWGENIDICPQKEALEDGIEGDALHVLLALSFLLFGSHLVRHRSLLVNYGWFEQVGEDIGQYMLIGNRKFEKTSGGGRQVKRTRILEPNGKNEVEDTKKNRNSTDDVASDTTAKSKHTDEDKEESTTTILVEKSEPLERGSMPGRREWNDSYDEKGTEKTAKKWHRSEILSQIKGHKILSPILEARHWLSDVHDINGRDDGAEHL